MTSKTRMVSIPCLKFIYEKCEEKGVSLHLYSKILATCRIVWYFYIFNFFGKCLLSKHKPRYAKEERDVLCLNDTKGHEGCWFGRIKAQNNVNKALLTKMMVARRSIIELYGLEPRRGWMQAIDRGLAEFFSYLNGMEHQIKIYENNEIYMNHQSWLYLTLNNCTCLQIN